MKRADGFTLVELLVVVLVISILAAIAIPVYIKQRERGYEAQIKSQLKNAATAAESYGSGNGGDFSDLDGDNGAPGGLLAEEGYKASPYVSILAASPTGAEYCFTAVHSLLPAGPPEHPWRTATYNSTEGSPGPTNADAC